MRRKIVGGVFLQTRSTLSAVLPLVDALVLHILHALLFPDADQLHIEYTAAMRSDEWASIIT